MRIKIGTAPIKTEVISYVNEMIINFSYNNLNEDAQKKYSEIIKNIRALNKEPKIKIIINSTNSIHSNDIEVEYKIELNPNQFPTKELNSFYSNFTNFLNEFKKKNLEENTNETAMDNLIKTYEISTLSNQINDFEESEKSIFSSNKFYHGSSVKFDKFDLSKAKDGWFGKCIYFTDNKTLAKGFGKYIYEVELDIKNPYFTKSDNWMQIVDDVNKEFNADRLQETDLTKVLNENGFDGIVFNTNWDKSVGNIYTVANSNQIKIVSVEENKKRNFNKTK